MSKMGDLMESRSYLGANPKNKEKDFALYANRDRKPVKLSLNKLRYIFSVSHSATEKSFLDSYLGYNLRIFICVFVIHFYWPAVRSPGSPFSRLVMQPHFL